MNKTEIVIVLDRSGSMAQIKSDIEGGFKTYLDEQKKLPGECSVTLAQFDDAYELVYENVLVKNINGITIEPRNYTALIDAVCKTIDSVGARLAAMPEKDRPTQVDFMILTDGHENASKEFTSAQMNEKIKHQRDKYNWKITFMGCNQDAVKTGASYGILRNQSLTFDSTDKQAIASAFSAKSAGTSFYRTSADVTEDYGYTAEQRKAADKNS